MKIEIIDRLLSSESSEDVALGIEYMLKLKKKDIQGLIPEDNLKGYDSEIGEYSYAGRTTHLITGEYDHGYYVSRGTFKILIRNYSIMTCNISAKILRKWGWTKKKS